MCWARWIGELRHGYRGSEWIRDDGIAFRRIPYERRSTRASPPGSHRRAEDVSALAKAGAEIRDWVASAPLPSELSAAIAAAYRAVADGAPDASWAVRSSATADDLPEASFAGQQETFLNIKGLDNILHAIKDVFDSLYKDRAIAF